MARTNTNTGGGGGGTSIGGPVTGGLNNRILFVHPNGVLAQSADFTWNDTTKAFNVNGTETVSGHSAFGGAVIDTTPFGVFPILVNVGKTLTTSTSLFGVNSFINLNPVAAYNNQGINAFLGRAIVAAGNAQDFSSANINGADIQASYAGTNNTNANLLVRGALFAASNNSSGNISDAFGVASSVDNNDVGTIDVAAGYISNVENHSMGTINLAVGMTAQIQNDTAGGTIDTSITVLAQNPKNVPGGIMNTVYGLDINDHSGIGAVRSWNLFSEGVASQNIFEGHVTIGMAAEHPQAFFVQGGSILNGGGQLNHDNGFTSIDWQNDSMRDGTFGTPSINWFQRVLFPSAFGQSSLDWENRQLITSAGGISLWWDARTLNQSSGATVVDWENQRLDDAGNNKSADWAVRQLYDNSVITSLDWNNRQLTVGPAVRLDWNIDVLNDNTGATSMNWDSRLLKDSTGGTTSLDWQNRTLDDGAGIPVLDWANLQFTNSWTFSSSPSVPAIPVNPTDAASKSYVDTFAAGLSVKMSVDVATTPAGGNIILSGEQTIDGFLTSTSRVLVKNQTLPATNGIYVSAAGAWTRATDYDTSPEVGQGTFTTVINGTVNANTQWVQVTPTPTINVDPLVFSLLNAGTTTASLGVKKVGSDLELDFVANDGLKLLGNSVTVSYDNSSIGIVANQLAVKSAGITNTMLAGSIDNTKLLNSSISVATGTSGADFNVSGSPVSLGGTVTLNIPSSSAVNRGLLTSVDWTTFNGKQAAGSYITALIGDVTATGPGSVVATLANSGVVAGTYGSGTTYSQVTVDAKGRITVAQSNPNPYGINGFTKVGTTTYEAWYAGQTSAIALTTAPQPANDLRCYPVIIPRTITLDQIGQRITVAGAAGSFFRCAIYADNGNNVPGNIVAGTDSGNLAGDTTGNKTTAIAVTLTPGLYWFATNNNSGTGITFQAIPSAAVAPVLGSAAASVAGGLGQTFAGFANNPTAFGAMPGTFPLGTSGRFTVPPAAVWYRRSA